jgi:hypothetical protein
MKRMSIIPLAALLAVLLSACDREGPAEKAGERIDEVTEDIREGGEDLGNEIEDACEELKEDMGAEDKDC